MNDLLHSASRVENLSIKVLDSEILWHAAVGYFSSLEQFKGRPVGGGGQSADNGFHYLGFSIHLDSSCIPHDSGEPNPGNTTQLRIARFSACVPFEWIWENYGMTV